MHGQSVEYSTKDILGFNSQSKQGQRARKRESMISPTHQGLVSGNFKGKDTLEINHSKKKNRKSMYVRVGQHQEDDDDVAHHSHQEDDQVAQVHQGLDHWEEDISLILVTYWSRSDCYS